MPLQFPQPNINGTSKEALVRQYRDVHRALGEAIELICEHAPHGRDYQTLPAGSFEQARSEHFARLAKLENVKAEIEAIAIHIQE